MPVKHFQTFKISLPRNPDICQITWLTGDLQLPTMLHFNHDACLDYRSSTLTKASYDKQSGKQCHCNGAESSTTKPESVSLQTKKIFMG